MIFRIARSPEGRRITRYDDYNLSVTKGMTVLDVLFRIQDDIDPSLSFRYSCRGAVCGSCAMLIDRVPRLACRTPVETIKQATLRLREFPGIETAQLKELGDSVVIIEPLPVLPVLKDLVVDMSSFYQRFEAMKLWTDLEDGQEPRTQIPAELSRFDRYANCISCAICLAACPVCDSHTEFMGPAALAKAWRFHQDSRVMNRERYLEVANRPEGAPTCELVMNCVKACPKGVAPGGAIREIKSTGQ
jgi:succinate dehydrogenase / fumarate reductase iron-sulfur subunit